jgi:hypothetical protein
MNLRLGMGFFRFLFAAVVVFQRSGVWEEMHRRTGRWPMDAVSCFFCYIWLSISTIWQWLLKNIQQLLASIKVDSVSFIRFILRV